MEINLQGFPENAYNFQLFSDLTSALTLIHFDENIRDHRMCQHQQNDRRYALVIHFYGFTCVLIKLREYDCARDEIFIFSRLGSCVVLMDKKENLWTDAQTKGVRTIEFNLLDFSSSVRLTFNRRRIIFFIVV